MASAATSSGNGDAKRYHRCLDIVIMNFELAKKQVHLELRTSASNDELESYGEEMGNSRWLLRVSREEVGIGRQNRYVAVTSALEGNSDIELMTHEWKYSIIGLNGEPVFSRQLRARNFSGVDVRQQPLSHKDLWGLPEFISYAELAKNPQYTPGDCLRIRAKIIFSVISGGTPPATTVPAILPIMPGVVPAPDSAGPDADEHILNSSDGRRFRVEKQHLIGMPYFTGIVNAIKDPKEGATLCHDGETLEIVFNYLQAKQVMSLALSKKVLIAVATFAADSPGLDLKGLQTTAMTPFITNLSIEKATDSFQFADENKIISLKERLVSLVPSLLEKVTGTNAAKALILSVKMDNPVLRKKALDVIAQGAMEFFVAGGIAEIASVPGLAAEVQKAAAEYMATNTASDTQDEPPAKKAKTTP